MTRINILPPHLADMIAAGEVVERPASVIKELMENAFDAGAKKVTVEFKNGGAPYIRISDDGCGMSPEDAGIAFMRHATSKLHDERGLEAIGTMGFRGEALAAISAVSRIELCTREKGSDEGIKMTVEAGDIVDMLPCGCPEGTSITVRDIFFNTPARLKFLKSDRSEASACIAAALHCALGRPEVSVRCIRDGAEEFFTPGDARSDSAVYSLLGRELATSLLPCRGSADGVSVEGFVSSPAKGQGSRSRQYFFCNGRYIRSALLQSAVEQAYRNTLLTGRFPACVIYLTLGNAAVDVNVHPAKTEVKFSEEKKVFDAVYQTVRSALEAEDKPLEISLSEGTIKLTESASATFNDRPRTMSSRPSFSERPAPVFKPAPARAPQSAVFRSPMPEYDSVFPASTKSENVEKAVETVEKIASPAYRLIGEALNTYILVEFDGKLLLIDKHAAHERMIFDRLVQSEREVMSQTLLEPILVRLSPEDSETLEANGETLSELGFELEPFGEGAYALRALPEDIDPGDAAAAVEELCVKLRTGGAGDAKAGRTELLHTVACKAAIKAGRRHDPAELDRIAKAVVSGEVRYCPHGRPVSVTLTKAELDKFFSRIV